ncbi:MAG: glutathione S-transferase [Sphingomonadales bacterium]|jgi:glutathione S-transferase|nr:glutathione S-transferase [Sphingomonadales bacterium]
MTSAADARRTLLTFAPMVDSETSRLLLRHYGVDYRESDHLLPWASLLTLFHGGKGQVPLLYGAGPALTGPWAIAEHYDAMLPPERRLVPPDGPLAAQVKADWDLYNGGIGADAAAFAYFHLLPHGELMKPVFAAPVGQGEKHLLPVAYPLLRLLFRLLLRLSPERAEQAAARIRATFDLTGKRIADGRPYLCGDRLTIGDIGLAAASAPLLLPEGYGAAMPAPEAMPPPVAGLLRELRAHPTGKFVQRLYAEGLAP